MPFDDSKLIAHLSSILQSANRPSLATSVIPTLVQSIDSIARTLRSAQQVTAVGSANTFGDEQLNVDVLAEQAIRSELKTCPAIVAASSEEDPVERPTHEPATDAGDERYTIAFDPLDGSSIIAPNWTVGTLIGVWDGASALHAVPAEKQVASVLGVYGPRTTVFVAVRVPGALPTCFELGLVQHSETSTCEITRPRVLFASPPFQTRYFAPANLRAAAEDERYARLISHYIQSRYTLRYSGGLVPDVVHALVKGHGVYVSPVTSASAAKLRRLYELGPVALVVECAGGRAVDAGTGEDVLARAIGECGEKGGLVCGTGEEVGFVMESFGLV